MRFPGLLGLAFLILPCAAQTAPQTSPQATPQPQATGSSQASAPPAKAPTGGMLTYRNPALGITYSYPADYTDASGMVGPAMQAGLSHEPGAKDATRCVTLPFSAMSGAAGKLSVVLIVHADAGCLKKNFTAAELPEFTQGEVQGLAAFGARTQFGKPVAFTAQDHPAELLRGTFELPTGQQLHAMVTCVLLKPDVVCWQFLASSEEGLHTMSAFPVSLAGTQPAPLIPGALLAGQ